ncbi:MAG: glycosyltransferase [Dehalococcoidales bacterium]|nr:glycosyltransferase [Dehalococcoidales bacterium]
MGNIVDRPLVSIITPVRNGIKYLPECIQSVLDQSYPNIEHVIVDGVSTDGTLEMLADYKSKYPDQIKFISEPDKSAGEAWIKGVRIAKGSILGWLGADDTYAPDAVQKVVNFFETNHDAYFMFGGCNYINENGDVIRKVVTKDFDLNEAINNMCSLPTTSAFYKREVIDIVNPDIIAEQDSEVEYWIRVGKQFKIHRIEPVLSNFRVYSSKNRDQNDMYSFAKATYDIGRRNGAGIFSPCAKRYYLALATRPVQRIVDPVFHAMSTGDSERNSLIVRITTPFHPLIRKIYYSMTKGGQTNRE